MQATILSIGDELALGQTVDTNSAWLAARLARLGISTLFHHTVADDRTAISEAFAYAAARSAVVLVTGGLGPTEDDLTRDALADALGEPLVEDTEAAAHLETFFAGRGRPMPQRNRVQALHPRGSRTIPNPNGTAPGLRAELNGATIYVMPGVPREMRGMYEDAIEPELRLLGHETTRVILTTKIKTFGWGESDVAQALGSELMARQRSPTVGTTVSDGFCSIRIRSEGTDPTRAQLDLEVTAAEVEATLGPIVFGRDDDTLQAATLRTLVERGITLTTAESCTGGLVGGLLTDVPGSSGAYLGGWVTYANAMKRDLLGVPAPTLAEHGAVSEATVRAMAAGAMERAGAAMAVAVSGVAGPGGGTDERPVGTVWFALARRREGEPTVEAWRAQLRGDRGAVRDRAAKIALQIVRLSVMGERIEVLRWVRSAASL